MERQGGIVNSHKNLDEKFGHGTNKMKTGNALVDAMSAVPHVGNQIPNEWFQRPEFRMTSGAINPWAIFILSDLIYWYRWHVVRDPVGDKTARYEVKFKGDKLRRTWSELMEKFHLTEKQVRGAVELLEKNGLITREYRTVSVRVQIGEEWTEQQKSNIPYLAPVPTAVARLLEPLDTSCPVGQEVVPCGEPGALQGRSWCPVGQEVAPYRAPLENTSAIAEEENTAANAAEEIPEETHSIPPTPLSLPEAGEPYPKRSPWSKKTSRPKRRGLQATVSEALSNERAGKDENGQLSASVQDLPVLATNGAAEMNHGESPPSRKSFASVVTGTGVPEIARRWNELVPHGEPVRKWIWSSALRRAIAAIEGDVGSAALIPEIFGKAERILASGNAMAGFLTLFWILDNGNWAKVANGQYDHMAVADKPKTNFAQVNSEAKQKEAMDIFLKDLDNKKKGENEWKQTKKT